MVNRQSLSYRAGRFVGKIIVLAVGYVLGRNSGKKPTFPSLDPKNPPYIK